MPRYFFHVHDGVEPIDEEGTSFPDIVVARAEALKLAGDIIEDAGIRSDLGEDWCITVTDDAGLILFRMDFVVAESAAAGRRRAVEAGAIRRDGRVPPNSCE